MCAAQGVYFGIFAHAIDFGVLRRVGAMEFCRSKISYLDYRSDHIYFHGRAMFVEKATDGACSSCYIYNEQFDNVIGSLFYGFLNRFKMYWNILPCTSSPFEWVLIDPYSPGVSSVRRGGLGKDGGAWLVWGPWIIDRWDIRTGRRVCAGLQACPRRRSGWDFRSFTGELRGVLYWDTACDSRGCWAGLWCVAES